MKLSSAGQLNRDHIKTHLRVNLPRPQLGNGEPVIRTLTSTAHNLGALNLVNAVLQSVIEPGLKSVEECHTRMPNDNIGQRPGPRGATLATRAHWPGLQRFVDSVVCDSLITSSILSVFATRLPYVWHLQITGL